VADDMYAQVRSLVQTHCRERPAMELQDVYKLLYQAYLGIGHLLTSQEEALASLQQELARTPSSTKAEPLWENISPVDAVGRVNLRPFKEQSLDTEALSRGLWTFALNPPGNAHQLAQSWGVVGRLIQEGELPFGFEDCQRFTSRIQQEDYPAVHHSRAYANAYQPAYRVLSTELFRGLFPGRGPI